MAQIVPTVTAYNSQEYKDQLELACGLSKRISLDFMDGIFTPAKNINLIQAYWPPDMQVDLHVMYENPSEHMQTIISLKPNLVIVHVEARSNLPMLIDEMQAVGIKAGVAFLQPTQPVDHANLLANADHALIFSGTLGSYGGKFDPVLLEKVKTIRGINPKLEISWDGGVSDQNADTIAKAGVNVLNVGGYLQRSSEPQTAYDTLKQIVVGSK